MLRGYDKTSAELTSEEKNKISHRGMAVKELERTWKEWLEGNKETYDRPYQHSD
jgi:ribonuclease PH